MANSWVDVAGLVSAQWPSMPTNMVNYTLNGSGTNNEQFSGVNYIGIDDGAYHTAYEYNGLKIEIRITNSGSTHSIYCKITLNGTIIYEDGSSGGSGFTYHPEIGIGFIWDENYNAKIVIMYHVTWSTNGNWGWSGCCTKSGHNYAHDIYNWIVNNPYVSAKSGGAGSGYIGNSLVSNKKMVGYNVPTSDAINTKTESVQVYSPAPLANMPKMGDGFARIRLIRESLEVNFWDIVLKSDLSAAVNCGSAPSTAQWNSDDILFYGESQKTKPTVIDGVFYHVGSTDYTRSCVSFPLKQEYIILGGSSKVNFIAKAQDEYHSQWIQAGVLLEQVYGKFLTEYAYKVSEYPEAVAVDAFGLYESAKNLSSPQTARRITVRFDYGTWEMFDIKVNILG